METGKGEVRRLRPEQRRQFPVAVDPSFPNAWTRPPFYAQIKTWAADGAAIGRFVFVRIGMRMIAVLPDREVDLGRIKAADEIVVSRQPGPAGLVYAVEVKRPAPVAA